MPQGLRCRLDLLVALSASARPEHVAGSQAGDEENLARYAAFNKKLGLPVTLEAVGLDESCIPALCEAAHATNEWRQGNPEPFTDARFAQAIKDADAFGKRLS